MCEKKKQKHKAADSLYALQERCVQCCLTSLYRFLELHHVLSMGLKTEISHTIIAIPTVCAMCSPAAENENNS